MIKKERKHFPCFHTVIETRVEVWENEKLAWSVEHELSKASVSNSISSFAKLPQIIFKLSHNNCKFSISFDTSYIYVCSM